jgi:hypothetical protein
MHSFILYKYFCAPYLRHSVQVKSKIESSANV